MTGRQEGYEGSHQHHLHCGGTTGVTDGPGCLTGPPLPQFPCSHWACSPYLLLRTRGRPLLASSPPHCGTGGGPPRPKTGGAGERTAAPPYGAKGPGRRREPQGPCRAGLSRALPRQAKPSFPERSRAFPSEVESCRAKPSLAERNRALTRTLPSQTERCRAEPELCRAGLRPSRALPELRREQPSR